jgi:hypothetical protein
MRGEATAAALANRILWAWPKRWQAGSGPWQRLSLKFDLPSTVDSGMGAASGLIPAKENERKSLSWLHR